MLAVAALALLRPRQTLRTTVRGPLSLPGARGNALVYGEGRGRRHEAAASTTRSRRSPCTSTSSPPPEPDVRGRECLHLREPLPEAVLRLAREEALPWIREHVVPLLASPTERRVGEIVVSH